MQLATLNNCRSSIHVWAVSKIWCSLLLSLHLTVCQLEVIGGDILYILKSSVGSIPKNKERPLGEDKWAWYQKSRGEWEGQQSFVHVGGAQFPP